MMELVSGESLSILLGAAGAYKGQVSWITQSATTHVPGSKVFTSNGATPVSLIANPGAGNWSQLVSLGFQPTSAATVKIRKTDGVTTFDMTFSLDANDVLTYNNAEGWLVFTSAGSVKGAGGGSSSLTVKEIDGAPTVAGVTTIRVSNGTLTDDGGGQVTVDTSGGGGGSSGLAAAYVL